MDYADALAWLYSLEPRGIRLELDRLQAVLGLRGHPERALPVVHVAGTNGKGSVAAMVAAGLGAAGRRAGLYTSPHLHSFTERIQVDGVPLGRDELVRRVRDVRATLAGPAVPELTFFEVATLVALEVFRDARVEVAVLEVGLGGRLDATNVLDDKLATAITGIALDHQAYLGSTLAEIAGEKAGILRPGAPLAVGSLGPEARAVIEARASALGVEARWVGRQLEATDGSAPGSLALRVGTRTIDGVVAGLAGRHQRSNLAVAASLLDTLGASDEAIRAGLGQVRWPGRLERVGQVLLDAAHNPDGCRALASHLASLPRTGPRVLVFGAMADKAWAEMLAILAPQIDRLVAVAPSMRRAEPAASLAAAVPGGEVGGGVIAGLDRALELAGADGLVVVAGSIFVLAEARARLLEVPTDPPLPL